MAEEDDAVIKRLGREFQSLIMLVEPERTPRYLPLKPMREDLHAHNKQERRERITLSETPLSLEEIVDTLVDHDG